MSTKILIDPLLMMRHARTINDIELGATIRALCESALDDGRSKRILDASYYGTRTNGFVHIDRDSQISASDCDWAVAIREA